MAFDIQSLDGGALEFQTSCGIEVVMIALRSSDFTQNEDGLFVVRDAVSAPSKHGGTSTKALLKDKDGKVFETLSVDNIRNWDADIRLSCTNLESGETIQMDEFIPMRPEKTK